MTAPLVDTTDFQLGVDPNQDAAVDGPLLAEMEEAAQAILEWRDLPPRKALLLAYALPGVIALYLAQFETAIPVGESQGDMERWVVVGDLPPMEFETDDYETRERALRLYCAIAQDWADNVLAGEDLTDCYPIAAEPTDDNARMLLSRIDFIREELVPLVGGPTPAELADLSYDDGRG